MQMQTRVTNELEIDDDGTVVWVSRARLGHVSEVADYDLPAELWPDLERAKAEHEDAADVAAEARHTFNATRGKF